MLLGGGCAGGGEGGGERMRSGGGEGLSLKSPVAHSSAQSGSFSSARPSQSLSCFVKFGVTRVTRET